MADDNLVKDGTGAADENVKRWRFLLDLGIDKRNEQTPRWAAAEGCADMRMWRDESGAWVEGGDDEPSINKAGSFMRTYRAAICYKNPRAKMKPKKPEGYRPVNVPVLGPDGKPLTDQMGAIVVKPVLPYMAREALFNNIISAPLFGLFHTNSRIIYAACTGYGAGMVGYKPTFATPLEKDTDDEIPILPDGTIDLSGFELDAMTGGPLKDDRGNLIRKNRNPVHEEWFFDWVHYRKIIIDPRGGNDFMKHKWVAVEEVRTVEELQNDDLLSNTEDLKPTGMLVSERARASVSNEEQRVFEEKMGLVRCFRIFDFVKDRMLLMADGHDKMLYDEVMPRGITHSPLGFFRPNERILEDEEFYPRAPLADAVPLITEKNAIRRQIYLSAKRAIRKVIIEKSTLEEPALKLLANDVDMEIIALEKPAINGLDKAIHVLNMPAAPQDAYVVSRMSDADFDEVMGQGAASRGGSSGDTATEENKRTQYEVTRYDFDRMQYGQFLREMFKKLDDSIDANMTIPRAVELIGTDGMTFTGLVDRDLIAGDVEIEIDVQEMAPTDGDAEAARMIQFLQVIGQNPWIAADETVLRPLAERMHVKDENLISKLAQMAAAQAAMAANPQPKVPNAEPPKDEAQAIQQTGAGTQVPRMQGAA